METLELFELANLLPYSILEEALEYNIQDLLQEFSANQSRCKPKISCAHKSGLESLIMKIDFEREVEKEVKKMMNSNSLYDALIDSFSAVSINDLVSNAIPTN